MMLLLFIPSWSRVLSMCDVKQDLCVGWKPCHGRIQGIGKLSRAEIQNEVKN